MRALGTRQIAFAVIAGVVIVVGIVLLVTGDDDVNNNADRYDGTEEEVASVIDDLGQAGRDGEGQEICDEVFASELADFIERESGQSCASEVDENVPEGEYELTVETIEIQDDQATVVVNDHQNVELTVALERIESDWRVTQVLPRL